MSVAADCVTLDGRRWIVAVIAVELLLLMMMAMTFWFR
jgi:hypothetical protein